MPAKLIFKRESFIGQTTLGISGYRDWLPTRTLSPAEIIRKWYAERSYGPRTVTPKNAVREAHLAHRQDTLKRSIPFLREHARDLLSWFAIGSEVRPTDVQPEVIAVEGESEEAHLFRLASLWWSVPVSHGFGRRQRFIVIDSSNNRLIGIFALGDPVFNLGPRDQAIGWSARDRRLRLRYVVDAFVLGAVPPYSDLLGGKLIAALATATETEQAFCRKYQGRRTIIREMRENASLALLTTSSVFGKSSVYDRLRVNDRLRFDFMGMTKGFGHFHVPPDVFAAMVSLLEREQHSYAHGNRFGNGPNWKIRVIRVSLEMLGLDVMHLNHGFCRGVYAAPLASNFRAFLRGEQRSLRKDTQSSVEAISEVMKGRWILPRSVRRTSWREINGAEVLRSTLNSIIGTKVL